MPVEDAVKRLGRVEYIEPNGLFVHSEGDKIQNGIPQPYEDYSFSVNLRVINGDRYDCGMTSQGTDITQRVIEYSSDNGTLSFMDGTSYNGGQGYLTTNFTDISMNNPETNTKECLGIENITIKYDSWYYPTVTIKFVDVKGASLMLPAEYEYYNNGGPNLGRNNATSNSDFFRAFFSFPYPMFKLSVKGFYGKEITYDLSVLKCNVDFNSSNGNFEINASFIGYMYGMYGDLPFPFVYIAPYINLYGKNTWDEKRATGDFCYITTKKEPQNGVPMYTFPDLRKKVQDAGKESDKLNADSAKGKFEIFANKLYEKIDKEILPYYPPASKNNAWKTFPMPSVGETPSGYFFLSVGSTEQDKTVQTVFEDFYRFSQALHEYNEDLLKYEEELTKCEDRGELTLKSYQIGYKQPFEDFYTDAKEFLEKRNLKITAKFSTDDITGIKGILNRYVASLSFSKDEDSGPKETLALDTSKSSFGNGSKSDYDKLINELKTEFDNNEVNAVMRSVTSESSWTIRVIKTDNTKYKSDIVDTSNKLKSERDKILTGLAKFREQHILDAIGFDPTMRNMFNMVFAHIDTFMSVFYNTLDRIRKSIESSSDDTRKYDVLCGGNGSEKIEVDVSDSILKKSGVDNKLPPFTLFYKEETVKDSEDKKFTTIWPGDLVGGSELDEVKLVEAIINATALNRRNFDTVSSKDNVILPKGNIVPINYYDLTRGEWNPYLHVINDKETDGSVTLSKILEVFMFRCYYSLLNGSYVMPDANSSSGSLSSAESNFSKKAELIAELEAGNVIRAFELLGMSPNDSFITELYKLPENGSSFIEKALKGDNEKFVSVNSDKNISYNWIKVEDKYRLLPLGTFDTRTLENYAKNAVDLKSIKNENKFLKIGNTGGTSMNGEYACHIYQGGNYIAERLSKYATGDFVTAKKLFKNASSYPAEVKDLGYRNGIDINTTSTPVSLLNNKTVSASIPNIPSVRITEAGMTSIFMDPFYYAQTGLVVDNKVQAKPIESRAYLFLLGVPYGNDKKFFLPKNIQNGDYQTLMLLREGAVYWRSKLMTNPDTEKIDVSLDPITYEYEIDNVKKDVLSDIEKNDPCLGRKLLTDYVGDNHPSNITEGRKEALIKYFLDWVYGTGSFNREGGEAKDSCETALLDFKITFGDIEAKLALWEKNGDSKKLLSTGSCSSAITVELTSNFANGEVLRSVYNVSADNKLGKLSGKIRKDVFLRKSTEELIPVDIKSFLELLAKFYSSFDTIIDFSCLDEPESNYSVPRKAMETAVAKFIEKVKYQNKVTDEQLKEAKGVDSRGVPEDSYKKPEQFKGSAMKLACYLALKSMYDRWICSRRRESWYFSVIPERMKNRGIKSDFLRFFYIDEFYHDIGMDIRPNITRVSEMACSEGGFTEESDESNLAGISIMKILSNIAEFGGCALITLPTMLGLAKTYEEDNNSIEDVFVLDMDD